jgi:hypothetical protein
MVWKERSRVDERVALVADNYGSEAGSSNLSGRIPQSLGNPEAFSFPGGSRQNCFRL